MKVVDVDVLLHTPENMRILSEEPSKWLLGPFPKALGRKVLDAVRC